MKQMSFFRTTLLIVICIASSFVSAQTKAPVFQDVTPLDAAPVFRGNGMWGDYNNDGLMDLVVLGRLKAAPFSISLTFYKNNGAGFDIAYLISVPESYYNTYLTWIDYNNDGNLDLLLVGSTFDGDNDTSGGAEDAVFAQLYQNRGSAFDYTFAEAPHCGIKGVFFGQERIYSSNISVGDYNNDGYTDIAMIGNRAGNKVEVYTNQQGCGQFTLLENPVDGSTPFPSMNSGSLSWGDYNADGYLDLLIGGWQENTTTLYLYKNKGDGTFEQTLFQDYAGGIQKGHVGWLDANRDGKPDMLVSGEAKLTASPVTWSQNTILYIQNGSGGFDKKENTTTKLTNMVRCSFDYADINSDGLLDIFASGECGNTARTFLAMHDGNTIYTLSEARGSTLKNGYEGFRGGTSVSLCDFDNDGYLDLFAMGYNTDGSKVKIYQNTQKTDDGLDIPLNEKPLSPASLSATPGDGFTTLSWSKGSDKETREVALRYNIFVCKKNGEYISLLPADTTTGFVKISDCTLSTFSKQHILNIPMSDIACWGVQTIDQGKRSSKFAKQDLMSTDLLSGQEVPQLRVTSTKGCVEITTPLPQTISIYSIEGSLIRTLHLEAGSNLVEGLLRGVYIIGGQKLVVQ